MGLGSHGSASSIGVLGRLPYPREPLARWMSTGNLQRGRSTVLQRLNCTLARSCSAPSGTTSRPGFDKAQQPRVSCALTAAMPGPGRRNRGGLPGLDLSRRRWTVLMRRIVRWAAAEPDVRLALLVGSRARRRAPADRWSDTDIVLFSRAPRRLIRSERWVRELGPPAVTFVEETAVGHSLERRVLFVDGIDVDFAVFPTTAVVPLTRSAEGRSVLGRGFRILVDKGRYSARLRGRPLTVRPTARRAPTEDEFGNLISDFWYHCVWISKKLRRGELWVAKQGCDGGLKGLLLQMLEWQAHARPRRRPDTWHRGRFLERWADPEALRLLPAAFARYEAEDVVRALQATMRLFHRVSVDTAVRLGYAYPDAAERAARRLVLEIERA